VRPRGGDCVIRILVACAVPRAGLKRQIHPSNMQRLRIELLPRSYDLPACDRPRLLPLLTNPPTVGVSYSFGRMLNRSFDDAIVMQIDLCDSHVGRNRPFSLQVSPDQGIQRISPSPRRKGAHRDPSLTRNSAEQLGRSQPRRREAFLRLARSQRMKALPKQTSTVVITDEALS
jgi:hypothetical protein